VVAEEVEPPTGTGTGTAPGSVTDLRHAVGTEAGTGTGTLVGDAMILSFALDEKAPPTQMRHEARLTTVASEVLPLQQNLAPRMLKCVSSRRLLGLALLTNMYRPLSLHKPKLRLKVINRRNDLLNLRLGKGRP
jgi:hypothetical protein